MATLKIQYKLFAAMFAWSAILIGVLAFSIQESLDAGMIDYVNQKELESLSPLVKELGAAWLHTGNWDAFQERTNKFRRLLNTHLWETQFASQDIRRPPPPGLGPPSRRREGNHEPAPSQYGAAQPRRPHPEGATNGHPTDGPPRPRDGNASRPLPGVSYVLLDQNKALVAGIYPPDREYSLVELKPLEDVIGYLAVSKRSFLADGYELKFLDKQQEQLFLVASILLIVTFLLTLPFARHLVKPIRVVAHSLGKLSQGNYQQSLSTQRRDEFQLLFQNINNLAKTLAENEQSRQKWFADTAHDLRTPVAIMRGELEAMLDGVRKTDLKQIASIHSETLRLQRFIDDLHELARSELGTQHYQKSNIDLRDVIVDVSHHCSQMLAKHDIEIRYCIPETPQIYLADEFRLAQCLDNLLSNIGNYAHQASLAQITLTREQQQILITVADDGGGVAEQHMTKLFDHLYRVEESRNRNTGGSGLGLAICRNIVQAHHGSIRAETASLGGLAIIITLPLN